MNAHARRNTMWYVYLLKKIGSNPTKNTNRGNRDYYVGLTNNIHARFTQHQEGKVKATQNNKWDLSGFAECENRHQAAVLERWLKTGNSREKRLCFERHLNPSVTDRLIISSIFIRRALLWDANRELRRGFNLEATGGTNNAV